MSAFLTFLLTHKLLILLVVATSGLAISTIILGVDNSDLRDQLAETSTPGVPESTPQPPPPSPTDPPTTRPPPITTTTPVAPPDDMSKYRLPASAVPVRYDLTLYPDLGTGLFRGRVVASTGILADTGSVVMHGNRLKVTGVSIGGKEGRVEVDEAFERITLSTLDGSGFVGGSTVDIVLDFEGDMKNRIVGLYSSSYLDEKREERYIATSKFEPTYARQAFPCFDEPNMKATYKVHLLRPNAENYTALSNYPVEREEEVPEGVLVHFDETVPMSTYLSCFIVSDFTFTPYEFANGPGVLTPLRVYATPAQRSKTAYAGYVGQRAIEFYVNYFGIPYPLPKLDMVAIPDFVSGAMEHWGLVTYRETALLYTAETHSASNKQRVAEVVAHELAHSWFGNLVTMDWWDNLWLNEGFASYIQYKGVQAAEPDWGMTDQFLIGDLHGVLSLDATQGSHPIIQTVTTPDQITEVFDTISYSKGASVLRMLESAVGPDNFKSGVTNYLNRHAYKNAVTKDLWAEIQAVVGDGLNVTDFMDTFTIQMGYPILTVTRVGDNFVLTQSRFLKDPSSSGTGKTSPLDYKWTIPVNYVTPAGISQTFWFKSDQEQLLIPIPQDAKWVKFNADQVGYYRVNYPPQDWQNLIDNLGELTIADRAHLLEETFRIAESGGLSYTVALNLTKRFTDETDYVPWSVASSQLQRISQNLKTSAQGSVFDAYAVRLLQKAYDELGWVEQADELHLKKLTRVVVLNLACVLNYDRAIAEAKARFDAWIADGSISISPDLRTTIYKYGIVNANEESWTILFDRFVAETDASEKLKLMNALANVRNPVLLTRLIELARTEQYVRGQDYFTLMQYIASNPIGTPIVWDYVRENWDVLVSRFGLNERNLGRMIPSITSTFSTRTKLGEMESFFNGTEPGAGAAARVQALETVRNNIKWLADYRETVEKWVEENASV